MADVDWSDERATNLVVVAAIQMVGLFARLCGTPWRGSRAAGRDLDRLIRDLPGGSTIEQVRPDGSITRVVLSREQRQADPEDREK